MNCCWWCTLEIKGDVLKLPHRYDDRACKFHLSGQFCSWECMKSYNIHENRRNFGEIQNNITLMRLRMYGQHHMRTRCAPHRNCLQKFGGTLTPDEYGKDFKIPPILTMPATENFIHRVIMKDEQLPVHTQVTGSTVHAKEKRLAAINSVSNDQKTDSLRLKRPIPIRLGVNNIENALGLVRKPTIC
jgi:hypothetical protein